MADITMIQTYVLEIMAEHVKLVSTKCPVLPMTVELNRQNIRQKRLVFETVWDENSYAVRIRGNTVNTRAKNDMRSGNELN